MKVILFLLTFLIAPVIILIGFTLPGRASVPAIPILTIEGVINPLSARYFKRELERATNDEAQAIVLQLNTPGGLESSMREMVQDMLTASIPVIVYVTPQGGRAASAGMFLTIGGHVAAMSPGTNIGAAHPVSLGGEDQKNESVMSEKVVNDAAAFARAIAIERGRNAEWAELAVRKSESITANEAVKQKVVDFVAADINELLRKLDGRQITLKDRAVTLRTVNVRLIERPMHFPERVLHVITDPNIAYLLLSIGFIGIIVELYSPGLFVPGISGVICLLIGFTALGSLPIGWAGLILLAIGIGLLVLETQDPGIGIFGLTGIIAFILGSLMLYAPLEPVSPALPRVRVNPWLIGSISIVLTAVVLLIVRAAISTKQLPRLVGGTALVGKWGVAATDLAPKGMIILDREKWSAIVKGDVGSTPIRAGERVKVVGLHGAVLEVQKGAPHDRPFQMETQPPR